MITTNNSAQAEQPLQLKPVEKRAVKLRIVGTAPLIQHKFSEKSKRAMREKQAGKKLKTREIRDPKQEGEDAAYRTDSGEYGVPAMAIKGALITAAHKDIGVAKTLVQKAIFIRCTDRGGILRMNCSEPDIREDTVVIGSGTTDLRYRPYFYEWSVDCEFVIDAGLLQVGDLVNLVERAGFGVGIGEWRPDKGGEYGRFEIDTTRPVEHEGL
jgi:hypothetical protein